MEQDVLDNLRRRSRTTALVSAAGALFIIGSIAFAAAQVQFARHEVDKAKTELADLKTRKQGVSADIDALEKQRKQAVADRDAALMQKKQAEDDLAKLKQATAGAFGYASAPRSTQSLIASAGALKLLETVRDADTGSRQGTTVNIYSKTFDAEVNKNVVLPKLRSLGFAVRVSRPAAVMSDVPTNTLWFGADVKLDDVKLVALTLMTAGVKLRSIKPFANPAGPKRATIEVGAYVKVADAPPLTPDFVKAAQAFTR